MIGAISRLSVRKGLFFTDLESRSGVFVGVLRQDPEVVEESPEKAPGPLVGLGIVSLGNPEFLANYIGIRNGEALHSPGEWNDHQICPDAFHFFAEGLNLTFSQMNVGVLPGIADHYLCGCLPNGRLGWHHCEKGVEGNYSREATHSVSRHLKANA